MKCALIDSMVLPPHVVEELLERQKSRPDVRPQPRLYIDLPVRGVDAPMTPTASTEASDDSRGVVIIDLFGD